MNKDAQRIDTVTTNPTGDQGLKKTNWVKRLVPIVVLAGLAVLIISQGWHTYLSPKELAYRLEDLQQFISNNLIIALLIYMGIYIVVVALSLPGGLLLTMSGGLLFGWLIGGPATVVAATIGATIIFLIAKTALGEPLAAKAGPWLSKLREGFKQDALSYLLFLRLVPAFPFWLVNLAPGLLGVPLRTYVLGTFFGIIPGTFAFAYLGRGLDSVLEAARNDHQACIAEKGEAACTFSADPSVLVTKEILIALAALGIVALIPVVLKKFKSA